MNSNFSGVFLLDKLSGYTSHDAVLILRKRLNMKEIGHTGTLDPMATGLLILLMGESLKKQKEFTFFNKVYSGEILFGKETDTWDIQGKTILENNNFNIKEEEINNAIKELSGKFLQIVPPYSAIRYKGVHLYEFARKGLPVPVIKREVSVNWLNFKFDFPYLKFKLECCSGTYVRSLAWQLGQILKIPACLSSLRREKIGNYDVNSALSVDVLKVCDREKIIERIIKL